MTCATRRSPRGANGSSTCWPARRRRYTSHRLRANALEDHPWRDWAVAQEEASAKGQRLPGATSRWNRGKDLSWEPLRPERVCEVAYDHMQGTRFRHAAKFLRWRPDKRPQDCRYDQLEVTPAYELDRVFGARDPLVSRAPPAGQGS